jgi:hypothetical protein
MAPVSYHPTIIDPFPLSADPTTVGDLIQRLSRGRAFPAIEDGLITQSHLPSPADTANPWIRLFHQIHDTYEPARPFDGMTVYGMAAGAAFAQALRHAGRNPSRQSIIAAIDAGTADSGGPGLVPLPYSATDHDGYPGAQIGVIRHGQLQLAGPLHYANPDGQIASQPVTATTPPTTF